MNSVDEAKASRIARLLHSAAMNAFDEQKERFREEGIHVKSTIEALADANAVLTILTARTFEEKHCKPESCPDEIREHCNYVTEQVENGNLTQKSAEEYRNLVCGKRSPLCYARGEVERRNKRGENQGEQK